ncbi:MAG: pilin [Patescibacteria group bacterium]
MSRYRFLHIIILVFVLSFFAFSALPVHAFSFFSDKVVARDCFDCGACSICDLLLMASKGMRFLLSLSGAIALALLVYGGFQLLISQGKAEAVEHGKKMISGTVVGLFIILLAAWVWPNWVIISLKGIPTEGKPATIFSNDAWWITPCRKYKEGGKDAQAEKCATPAKVSPLTGTSADTCVLTNEEGVPIGFKESGTPCNECASKPCVCHKYSHDIAKCEEGCNTVADCQKRDPSYNLCTHFTTGGPDGRGLCDWKQPGTECKNNSDCAMFPAYDGTTFLANLPLICDQSIIPHQCLVEPHGACVTSGLASLAECRSCYTCVAVSSQLGTCELKPEFRSTPWKQPGAVCTPTCRVRFPGQIYTELVETDNCCSGVCQCDGGSQSGTCY